MENRDNLINFVGFPKIARLSRDIIISEKIDGTNASVIIDEDGTVAAASRTRLITPEDDNFGFARWVKDHEEELLIGLGIGRHFGEWWGGKIQRGYGLKEKRFSLFNVSQWNAENKPGCCEIVPTLYIGLFDTEVIKAILEDLAAGGSVAAPGFMDPEGIVIYHTAARVMFKKTIRGDEKGKGE